MLRNGLAAAGQLLLTDLRTMPGTVTTTSASASVATTSDLTPFLRVGDFISFSGEAPAADGSGIYGIAAITSTTITLAQNKSSTGNGAGQTASKENFELPDQTVSPAPASLGTTNITNGSIGPFTTSADFTASLSKGDGVQFAADNVVYVIDTITTTQITLKTKYRGSTSATAATRRSNFTPLWGRFGSIAFGWRSGIAGTTAVATETGLDTELTAGGLGRSTFANTFTTLQNPSADKYRCKWEYVATITSATQAVSELAIYNHQTVRRGVALLHQYFASDENLVLNDIYDVFITVDKTSALTTPSGGGKGIVTDIGLIESCKLLMEPTTTRVSNTTFSSPSGLSPSDWNVTTGTPFDSIALGTSATVPTSADLILGAETSASGVARTTGGSCFGTIMQSPTGTPPAFAFTAAGSEVSGADFTTFVGDTVQLRVAFAVNATVGINEEGVFNGSVAGNNDPAAGSRMLIHEVYGAVSSRIATDTLTPILRIQQT